LAANDNSSEAAKIAIQEILFDSRNWLSDLIILRNLIKQGLTLSPESRL
jgi:hypothetical protein